MEATLGGAQEDTLIGPLSLGLADSPGASYITQRKDASHYSAIPSCSYSGVNVLRVVVASSTEWADVANSYLAFTIQNEANAPLKFTSQPHIISAGVKSGAVARKSKIYSFITVSYTHLTLPTILLE